MGSSKFWQNVLQTLVIAGLLAVLGKVWTTYETVIELRGDVDRLYSAVDDLAKEID